MPWVDLPRRDGADPVSLWYKIQGSGGQPELDPTKQTLLLLHTTFMDIEALYKTFNDTRLRRRVNMIAFDQRGHGKTKTTVSPKTDFFTVAADIAIALSCLGINQRLHCVVTACAAEVLGVYLATLFPERFLSYTFYGLPLLENEHNMKAYSELSDFVLRPRDQSEFLQGVAGALDMHFTTSQKFITAEEETMISKMAIGRYTPPAARKQWEAWHHAIWRQAVPPEFLAEIKAPILIYHGRHDIAYQPGDAEELAEAFPNSKVRVEHIDGPLSCFFTNPSTFHTIILQFLSSHFSLARDEETPESPFAVPSPLAEPSQVSGEPMEATPAPAVESNLFNIRSALRKVTIIRGDPDPGLDGVKWEEPIMSEDFCALTKETIENNVIELARLVEFEKANAKMFDLPNYWENGQVDADFEFRFDTRHEYFPGQKDTDVYHLSKDLVARTSALSV